MNQKIADLYAAGNVKKAVHLLVAEIDQNPKKIDNYLQLSTYLIEQGSFGQASKLLEEAKHLVRKPQSLDYNLAVSYYMQGDFTKALSLLDKIPNDDLVLYQKALVYLKLGQPQKALAYALTIQKVDEKVKELIGDIWLNLGQLKKARDVFKEIPVENRTAKINFLLGVCFLENDRNKAEIFFARAKKQDEKYFVQAENQYSTILKMISGKEKSNE